MELIDKYNNTIHKLEICLELLTYHRSVLGVDAVKKLIKEIKHQHHNNNYTTLNSVKVPIMYTPQEAFDFITGYIKTLN